MAGDSFNIPVNRRAFVKYEGGYIRYKGKQVYIPPNWYPCTVNRKSDTVAVVSVVDEFGHTWTMESSPPTCYQGII